MIVQGWSQNSLVLWGDKPLWYPHWLYPSIRCYCSGSESRETTSLSGTTIYYTGWCPSCSMSVSFNIIKEWIFQCMLITRLGDVLLWKTENPARTGSEWMNVSSRYFMYWSSCSCKFFRSWERADVPHSVISTVCSFCCTSPFKCKGLSAGCFDHFLDGYWWVNSS